MNKLFVLLTIMVISLFSLNSFAWNPPASPAPASWISDSSGVLSAGAHARLDDKLRQINKSSANELAALIVPTLEGENITDVSDSTAKSWGVGKKGLDNGVLVVIAMKEHKTHISTGKGVEGDLPDLKCNDILQKVLRPHMRNGDVEGGLGATFDAISSSIENHRAEATSGSHKATPSCQVSNPGTDTTSAGLVLVAFGFVGALTWWYVARSNRRRRERAEAELARERMRLRARLASERLDADREARRKAEAARLQKALTPPPPVVTAPAASAPVVKAPSVPRPTPRPKPAVHHDVVTSAAAASAAAAAAEAAHVARQARERREEEERRERNRRDEEDRRRRREQEEEDERRRSSYSSSSSSFDWGGGSSGGGSDSGGFGGGDSGGGGSSGDW